MVSLKTTSGEYPSLYLHLTGYERFLVTKEHGVRDEVVRYYQAVTSSFDQRTWVADIDLPVFMASRDRSNIALNPQYSLPRSCHHSEQDRANFSGVPHLFAVDNWHELKDPPITTSVIRARGSRKTARDVLDRCIGEHMLGMRSSQIEEDRDQQKNTRTNIYSFDSLTWDEACNKTLNIKIFSAMRPDRTRSINLPCSRYMCPSSSRRPRRSTR